MTRYFGGRAIALTVLATLMVGSCSSGGVKEQAVLREQGDNYAAAPEAEQTTATGEGEAARDAPQQTPQLIKTANIALTVESVTETLDEITELVQQQGGDVLELQDNQPQNTLTPHTASMQLRVPQGNLEGTLVELSNLGKVESKTIQAEDVSGQLVDFSARLRNLRKTEEMLLDIMERSGSMTDVLTVSKELSNVRSQVEQIDAQLQDLRNRVAFSTISVQLEATVATPGIREPLRDRMGQTWTRATHSVGRFTTSLLQLGLWLIAYSPYLAILAVVGWLIYRFRKTVPDEQ
ncbi:DUF4349 domain-containing protein [Spirulina sp. CS-785/01]|uniref:DUF4349 domain-containing protein n=1 Tax=Spirulina sp. CS-785/01 TaxID=3021716 RepID=UPI00232C91CB|nr:DUF4349 domain-containing protein [Spirulina sp. CS-785/01]MDB9312787.1 DUF4349 domain-containing protein [Spirulina sp. CS-785/01]